MCRITLLLNIFIVRFVFMSNKTNSSVSVNIIPLNEVLQIMHQDVMNFKKILRDDKSAETVQQILEEIGGFPLDERLPEEVTNFIGEMLNDCRNYTADNLSSELTILAEELEESIAICQHEANVKFVRTILKVMLKHADEVTLWLEEEIQ